MRYSIQNSPLKFEYENHWTESRKSFRHDTRNFFIDNKRGESNEIYRTRKKETN